MESEDMSWMNQFTVLSSTNIQCDKCNEQFPVGMFVWDSQTKQFKADGAQASLSSFYNNALGHHLDCAW